MDANQIFELIEEIASESGKNAKIEMLKDNEDDELLKMVLYYTYNPMINYGVKNFEMPLSYSDNRLYTFIDTSDNVFGLLNDLASRKLTGNAARDAINDMLSRLNEESALVLARIIRKDMRAGFSESTVNKVWKDLIPEFPYMRMSLPKDVKMNKFSWKEGCFAQVKADGMFVNLNVYADGTCSMHSRNGTEIPMDQFSSIEDETCYLDKGYQYHGEMTVYRDGKVLPREIGNGILNSVMQGKGTFGDNEFPVFEIWDFIPLSCVKKKGAWDKTYMYRYVSLVEMIGSKSTFLKIIETKLVHSYQDAMDYYVECLDRGLEGCIVKDGNAPWKDGTSKFMFKMKLEVTVDLVVLEVEEGRKNTKNEGRAGALLCATSDGKLRVSVSIKGEDMRDYIDAHPDEYVNKIMPVTANGIMKPTRNEFYSLFLPRFAESDYRRDKTVADSLEEVQKQFDNAVRV